MQAVGFAPEPEGSSALGVLVTPWFMNLMRLPLDAAEPLGPGQASRQRIGAHRLSFIGAHEAAFGPYAMCSLASPMFEFADQDAAVATAHEVLAQLRLPTAKGEPDAQRRRFSARTWRSARSVPMNLLAQRLRLQPGAAHTGRRYP
ncbi:MAG: [NiFe]-hydrogenase assembly chaperone HybE [Giesbergeria sp.]